MALRSFGRLALFALSCLVMMACEHSVQTTSGRDYLRGFDDYRANSGAAEAGSQPARQNEAVRQAAAVEPILRFPARLGLARIDQGALTPVPHDEAVHWKALTEELGSDWGEFVPLSPLVAAFTRQTVQPIDDDLCSAWRLERNYATCLGRVVESIRLGAARQHIDAVLIYEGTSWSRNQENALGIAKLTIIGFWLAPSESIKAGAAAQALLLDFRNGYTYGHAQTELLDAASTITVSVGSNEVADKMRRQAQVQAVEALVPEVRSMLFDLRQQLAGG